MLTKINSTECFCNTKVAGLSKVFSYMYTVCYLHIDQCTAKIMIGISNQSHKFKEFLLFRYNIVISSKYCYSILAITKYVWAYTVVSNVPNRIHAWTG